MSRSWEGKLSPGLYIVPVAGGSVVTCAVSVARARSRVSRLWASRSRAHSRWSSPSLPSAASRRRDSWEIWVGRGGRGGGEGRGRGRRGGVGGRGRDEGMREIKGSKEMEGREGGRIGEEVSLWEGGREVGVRVYE